MDEEQIFDEACAGCLKNCFDILAQAIVTEDSSAPMERFRKCCDLCRGARALVHMAKLPPLGST